MSKRFTDTEKWGKRWFRRLAPSLKLLWIYILDKCDNSGVIDLDKELIEFLIGEKIEWGKVETEMEKQIIILKNGKWWIRDFIRFQYGDELRESNKPQRYVLNLLKMHGLYDVYMEYQGNEFREDLKELYEKKYKDKKNGKKRLVEDKKGIEEKIKELKEVWNGLEGIRHYKRSDEFDKKIRGLIKKYKIEDLIEGIKRFSEYHKKAVEIKAEIKRGNEVDHFKRYIESWIDPEEFKKAINDLEKWNKKKGYKRIESGKTSDDFKDWTKLKDEKGVDNV